ncbi:MAG: NADH-quinone oxidoreductase subunit L [Cytophagales bacterium]|nr:NADH-quinone oxidoreductase subunit L [Cytophagales bacterium]MDW8384141.1 NADH-quinone oxidoreductase subunit L [Flammeovirgaceae bacterium]
MSILNWVLVAWLFPLFVFLLFLLTEKYLSYKFINFVVSVSTLFIVGVALYLFGIVWGKDQTYLSYFSWIFFSEKHFSFSIRLDHYSAIMFFLVALIGGLVQWFSFTYLKDEPSYARYFAYLSMFVFAMLGLVMADNLLLFYVFWELVGFTSYLLIGFWSTKTSAVRAAQKAFLLNRIGDTGFLIAIITTYTVFQTLSLQEIAQKELSSTSNEMLSVIGLGLMAGAIGKSAQLPLSSWLPNAMEAPTPVSALLHAATMVAAGIYLLVRTHFLLLPFVRETIVFVGSTTALIAAFSALSQTDIKRVLAFSTISQIGYMMIAIGCEAPHLAMFHLLTHAFFKACLFLCAGVIISYLHHQLPEEIDAQDMRNMGELYYKLPTVFYAYSVAMLALVGFPFFSGFLSKDAILSQIVHSCIQNPSFLKIVCAIAAFLTVFISSFYMMRQYYYVFWKKSLFVLSPQRQSLFLLIPTLILAIGSLGVVFSPSMFSAKSAWFLRKFDVVHLWSVEVISILLSLSGMIVGYVQFFRRQQEWTNFYFLKQISLEFCFLDRLYTTFTRFALLASRYLEISDYFINQILHLWAKSTVVAGFLLAWFDRTFVDGAIKITYKTAFFLGKEISNIQKSNIQVLLKWTIALMLSLVGLIIFL